jgi:hypothetical protein
MSRWSGKLVPAGDREGVFVAGVAGHLIPAGDGEGVCLVGVAGMC